jgi:hypothetical protein
VTIKIDEVVLRYALDLIEEGKIKEALEYNFRELEEDFGFLGIERLKGLYLTLRIINRDSFEDKAILRGIRRVDSYPLEFLNSVLPLVEPVNPIRRLRP